jgi:two-component system OmpR family sensor kinase
MHIRIYFPLQLRLSSLSILLLSLALWCFGSITMHQATQQAYRELDATLSSRAASVQLGKSLLRQNTLPALLPGIAGTSTEGVAIEIFNHQMSLLATTDSNPGDPSQSSITTTQHSPIPWDMQAAKRLLKQTSVNTTTPQGIYSTITYQGQQIRIYTTTNLFIDELHIIQTARSEQSIEQSLNEIQRILTLGSILVILLSAIGGWLITRGVLIRVHRITQTAQNISLKRNFDQRVPHHIRDGNDELTQLTETFNIMLDHLEQLYTHQQRFIADASHELRAPITSICCNLDLLTKATNLPAEDAREALTDTKAEADRMGRLVNDLLTLAHADATLNTKFIETKNYKLSRMHVIDLDSLLLDVFRQYRPLKQDERQRPRLLLQAITPTQVTGDTDQLKQALVALLDNALKYTPPEGSISLSLTTQERWASIAIKDTGIGIAPEHIHHIFERFYRATHARDPHGSGLGLAIAQSILLDHHGSIEVESAVGQGSTFTIHIPLYQSTT